MPVLNFNKDKYLRIAQSENCAAALTQLQSDIARWEIEAFEGVKGYQPEMWREISSARDFARELWDQDRDKPKTD